MFGTWGEVNFMSLDGNTRGALQFNVACDPFDANFVMELSCPIYLIPSECTRVVDSCGQTWKNLEQVRNYFFKRKSKKTDYVKYGQATMITKANHQRSILYGLVK